MLIVNLPGLFCVPVKYGLANIFLQLVIIIVCISFYFSPIDIDFVVFYRGV